jgi:hypothetical protein
VTFAEELDELLERHLSDGGVGVLTLVEALSLATRKLCLDESGPRYVSDHMRGR